MIKISACQFELHPMQGKSVQGFGIDTKIDLKGQCVAYKKRFKFDQ